MPHLQMLAINALFGLLLARSAFAAEPAGVFKVDPVELVHGREVSGQESIYADHYIYRYLFSSEANKTAFLKDPAKYEIQLGGGCGRMGPLSGRGSVERYAVHDGKIYLFASDPCRDGFRKAPEKLLEQPDAPPTADDAARQRGRELLDKLLVGMGGAPRIDAIKSYRERHAKQIDHQGEKALSADTTTFVYPDRVAHESTWAKDTWGSIAVGDAGWFTGPSDERPMHRQQVDALRRSKLAHNLLHLLQSRKARDFTCAHVGRTTVTIDGKPVEAEQIDVALHGATTRISIDPQQQRVVALEYRGRGPRLSFGMVQKAFSQYRDFNGVTLPVNPETRFDGEVVPREEGLTVDIAVDGPIDESLFKPANRR